MMITLKEPIQPIPLVRSSIDDVTMHSEGLKFVKEVRIAIEWLKHALIEYDTHVQSLPKGIIEKRIDEAFFDIMQNTEVK